MFIQDIINIFKVQIFRIVLSVKLTNQKDKSEAPCAASYDQINKYMKDESFAHRSRLISTLNYNY